MSEIEQRDRARGIYLLPNLFTTAGLFAGFYAIVNSMRGRFDFAVVAIFIAMIMDSLDGRMARLTNTQTAFGAQYDSLSDMVAFGLAPAIFAYTWSLNHLSQIGWLVTFIYAASTGLRLARFNTHLDDDDNDPRYFLGLPCTAAAGFVASTVWIQMIYNLSGPIYEYILAGSVVAAALLMLSNVPYRSFKDQDFKKKVPFLLILIVLFFFVGVALDPPVVLYLIFGLYLFLGAIRGIWHLARHR